MRYALVFVLVFGCTETRADEGRDAKIQVERAQFFRDALPAGDSGPRILTGSVSSRAAQGQIERAAGGELEPSAVAVALGVAGDVGYWVVRADAPSAAAPLAPTFSASFSVSRTVVPGRYEVVLRAIDASGRFGPAALHPLDVVGAGAPHGRLVIALRWDTDADLDLHVQLPSGVEIFKRHPTEYEPPPPSAGPVPPSRTTVDGGRLDHDSNARCIPDGQHAEHVFWEERPPSGHYFVRIDTFSLCGTPAAHWKAEAILDGVRIASSSGTSTSVDERFAHNRGDGALAFELDIP